LFSTMSLCWFQSVPCLCPAGATTCQSLMISGQPEPSTVPWVFWANSGAASYNTTATGAVVTVLRPSNASNISPLQSVCSSLRFKAHSTPIVVFLGIDFFLFPILFLGSCPPPAHFRELSSPCVLANLVLCRTDSPTGKLASPSALAASGSWPSPVLPYPVRGSVGVSLVSLAPTGREHLGHRSAPQRHRPASRAELLRLVDPGRRPNRSS